VRSGLRCYPGAIAASNPLAKPAGGLGRLTAPDRLGTDRLRRCGRPLAIAVESGVAAIFVLLASVSVHGAAWILVGGLVGHGRQDLWQGCRQLVAGTGWWPPFCCAVDRDAGLLIALAILGGAL
jgi:hypothetical protein